MLKLARIDPAGMVSFFEKLETQFGGKEPDVFKYISTHPLTRDRIAKLHAEIGAPAEKFISLNSGKRWKDIAAACKREA
jgi:predicted Zn-dependent protease